MLFTSMNYKRLQWSEEYSVGHPELDEEHHELLNIANELIELAAKPESSKQDLLELLTKLGNHSLYHFDKEEELLKSSNWEGAAEHIKKHEQYRKEVRAFLKDFEKEESGNDVLKEKVAQYASDWVQRHMLSAAKERIFARRQ